MSENPELGDAMFTAGQRGRTGVFDLLEMHRASRDAESKGKLVHSNWNAYEFRPDDNTGSDQC